MKKIISVVGDAHIEPHGDKYNLAVELGKALVDAGYRVMTGGRHGIMEAAFIGARTSKRYTGNETIAISPFFDKTMANQHADIIISTGLDFYRNNIMSNADAMIAIGGGAGTLAEIANAWHLGKMVICYDNVSGWSSRMAGTPVDHRIRYPDTIPDDRAWAVKTAAEALKLLNERMDLYDYNYKGIAFKN